MWLATPPAPACEHAPVSGLCLRCWGEGNLVHPSSLFPACPCAEQRPSRDRVTAHVPVYLKPPWPSRYWSSVQVIDSGRRTTAEDNLDNSSLIWSSWFQGISLSALSTACKQAKDFFGLCGIDTGRTYLWRAALLSNNFL